LFNTTIAVANGGWATQVDTWVLTGDSTSGYGINNGWAGSTLNGVTPLPNESKYFLWVALANLPPTSFRNVTQNLYFPIGVYSISIWLAPRTTYNKSMSVAVTIAGTTIIGPISFTSIIQFTKYTGTYTCSYGGTYPVVIAFLNTLNNDSAIFCSNFVITKNEI
jgi:hypothetical protein